MLCEDDRNLKRSTYKPRAFCSWPTAIGFHRLCLAALPRLLSARRSHAPEERRQEIAPLNLRPNKGKPSLSGLCEFVCESIELCGLGFEFAIYFIAIRVIVGKSGVNLSQVNVRILIRNFFWS